MGSIMRREAGLYGGGFKYNWGDDDAHALYAEWWEEGKEYRKRINEQELQRQREGRN